VFSVGVLEHVRETGGEECTSLKEIRRVLAPDGLFICYHLPNRYSYIEALSRWVGKRKGGSAQAQFHEHRFTERGIRRLCGEAKLSLAEVGRYGFIPRNSFNRLPKLVRDSPGLASVVNVSDAALERLLSPLDQNYYFLARPLIPQAGPKEAA